MFERLRHLRDYLWSSARAYLAEEAAPSWLTIDAVRAQFGGRSRKDRIKAYREALHQAIAEGLSEPPWATTAGGLILGGKQFVEEMKKKLGRPGRESIFRLILGACMGRLCSETNHESDSRERMENFLTELLQEAGKDEPHEWARFILMSGYGMKQFARDEEDLRQMLARLIAAL